MSNEPETILQPTLHTLSEYVDMVLEKCECRDVNVSDLRRQFEADPEGAWIGEIAGDAMTRLGGAGYPNVEQEDTFLVWSKGG